MSDDYASIYLRVNSLLYWTSLPQMKAFFVHDLPDVELNGQHGHMAAGCAHKFDVTFIGS